MSKSKKVPDRRSRAGAAASGHPADDASDAERHARVAQESVDARRAEYSADRGESDRHPSSESSPGAQPGSRSSEGWQGRDTADRDSGRSPSAAASKTDRPSGASGRRTGKGASGRTGKSRGGKPGQGGKTRGSRKTGRSRAGRT